MDTRTVTLAEFLLARISEDEAVARAATRSPWRASTTYPNLADGEPGADDPCAYSVDCKPMEIREDGDGFDFIELDSWDRAGAWADVARWDAAEPNFRDASADADHIARHDPARVLAECAAKRRIVQYDGQTDDGHVNALRALALPYADHPDYDEAWRP